MESRFKVKLNHGHPTSYSESPVPDVTPKYKQMQIFKPGFVYIHLHNIGNIMLLGL